MIRCTWYPCSRARRSASSKVSPSRVAANAAVFCMCPAISATSLSTSSTPPPIVPLPSSRATPATSVSAGCPTWDRPHRVVSGLADVRSFHVHRSTVHVDAPAAYKSNTLNFGLFVGGPTGPEGALTARMLGRDHHAHRLANASPAGAAGSYVSVAPERHRAAAHTLNGTKRVKTIKR